MVEAHVTNKAFIDASTIRAAMKEWKYPLIYLDFETLNPPVPRYPGTSPYQHVAFQFSAHIQRVPNGLLEHTGFLHDTDLDPRPALIPALLEACGGEGTIVSYFAAFEKKRIEEMAAQFPQFRARLEALLPRFGDPLEIFRTSVYDPGFAGSFSLKAVAPTILGDKFSYSGMEVGDGLAAQRAFAELTHPETSLSRREQLRCAMLAYCEKDTLAMAEAVRWLRQQWA